MLSICKYSQPIERSFVKKKDKIYPIKIKNLKNVVIISQGKNSTLHNHDRKEAFDVIYLDISIDENLQTRILNHEMTLKNSGFLIIILNSIQYDRILYDHWRYCSCKLAC